MSVLSELRAAVHYFGYEADTPSLDFAKLYETKILQSK